MLAYVMQASSHILWILSKNLVFNFPRLFSLACFHHILSYTTTEYNTHSNINKWFVACAVLYLVLRQVLFIYWFIDLFLNANNSGLISTLTILLLPQRWQVFLYMSRISSCLRNKWDFKIFIQTLFEILHWQGEILINTYLIFSICFWWHACRGWRMLLLLAVWLDLAEESRAGWANPAELHNCVDLI